MLPHPQARDRASAAATAITQIARTTRNGDLHRRIEDLLHDKFDALAREVAAERDSDA